MLFGRLGGLVISRNPSGNFLLHSHPLFVSIWGFPVSPGVSYACEELRGYFFLMSCLGEDREKEVIKPCIKAQVSVSPAWFVAHLSLPGSVGASNFSDSLASFSYPWA